MSKVIKDLSLYDLKEIASHIRNKDSEEVHISTTISRLNAISSNLKSEFEIEKETANYKRISLTINSVKFILKAQF